MMVSLRRLIAVAAMTALLLGVASSSLASAAEFPEPHEDPDKAPWVFDGVSLFQLYSKATDHVLSRYPAGVEMLQDQASQANIPSDLKNTVDDFLSSGHALAQLIPAIEADLETLNALLSQFRLSEANQRAGATAQELAEAYVKLWVMETAAGDTVRWWQAATALEKSELAEAYEEVWPKLQSQRGLLDLFRDRLAANQEAVELLEELTGVVLRPTTITLSVEPPVAFVGDTIQFWGTLTAGEEALAGREITILLNGAPASVVLAGPGGSFHGELVLPYQYIPEMSIQALYYPQDNDEGLYLGSSSAAVTIDTLFYRTNLKIAAPDNAYPGRDLTLDGIFDYGDSPIPESRSLRVYWDNELIAEEMVAQSFTLALPVPEDAALGRHQVEIHVTAQRRYAPGWFTTEVGVVEVAPILEVDAPRIAFLPFGLNIRGRAYSTLGPLQDASMKIMLDDWQVTTTTRADGAFSAHLSTGMSLTLVGSQKLQVQAIPSEPWYKPGYSAVGLMVINLINIAGIGIAILCIWVFTARWLRGRTLQGAPAPSIWPAPATVKQERTRPWPEMLGPGDGISPEAILLALYRRILRLVQSVTAVALRPSHTMREFAQQCAPLLGPLAGYFQEFTAMMERLLYSRNRPGENDAVKGNELSQRLEEGLRSENP